MACCTTTSPTRRTCWPPRCARTSVPWRTACRILPAFAGLVGQPAVLARFTELNDNGGQWRDRLLDYLTAEQVLGRIAPDADVGAAGAILVGVCHETVLSTLLTGAPSAPSSVESVITVVLKGIDAS